MKNTEILKLEDHDLDLCTGGMSPILALLISLAVGVPGGWLLGEGIFQIGEECYRTITVSKDKAKN